MVNNLNDGMAWGLFPLFFAAAGLGVASIGVLAAVYPGVWGLSQLATGALSDRLGRKWLIASGMWVQAGGICRGPRRSASPLAIGLVLLGLGTALVYPTLIAAVSDVAHPEWRASAVGVYRLWRDGGYALGALLAGLVRRLARHGGRDSCRGHADPGVGGRRPREDAGDVGAPPMMGRPATKTARRQSI